jgi:hypothetical protein
VKLSITGIGIWARGARNWEEFSRRLTTKDEQWGDEWSVPIPAQIPGRERRRAPLLVKLAVEVAHQACDMAAIDKQKISSVFASAMGDTEITDYMCKTLAGPNKILSPTRFHNSVHNAPAGYWSISTGNNAPSSSVASSRESFPTALLEASVMSTVESRNVLLVITDNEGIFPLGNVYRISETFGVALVLSERTDDSGQWPLSIDHCSGQADWPELTDSRLRDLYAGNPAARCLALLEALSGPEPSVTKWPLSDATHLKVVSGDSAGQF